MTHAAVAALCILMLAGCSPQFTRYDVETASEASAYRPADPGESMFAAGFEAIRAGDYAGAEAPLKRHLEGEPDDPYALLATGVVLERTERADEAVTYYRRAALYGETAALGEVLSLDPATTSRPETIRDLALMNIARLAPGADEAPNLP